MSDPAALIREAAAALAAAGIEQPRREARLLLAHAAGRDAAALLGGAPVQAPDFAALVARRAAREPLAYLVGHQPFWTLDLLVSPATLVPRADSEAVVEEALAACPAPRRVLDLGTGTGCLLLAVLSERPQAFGVGVDRVAEAAALARRNAARNGLAARSAFLCGDWAAPVQGPFDLVLSNPPYIEHGALPGLMPDVALYEPASALDGGADGLDAYRTIMAALPGLLAEGGVAIFELGAGQAGAVSALAHAADLEPGPARRDLGGVPRALPVRRKKSFGEAPPGR